MNNGHSHCPKTEVRRVRYRWHLFYYREIVIRRELQRREGAFVACRLDGDERPLIEVPAWMFDAAACASMVLTSRPHVSFGALRELRRLLDNGGGAARAQGFTKQEGDCRHDKVDTTSNQPPSDESVPSRKRRTAVAADPHRSATGREETSDSAIRSSPSMPSSSTQGGLS